MEYCKSDDAMLCYIHLAITIVTCWQTENLQEQLPVHSTSPLCVYLLKNPTILSLYYACYTKDSYCSYTMEIFSIPLLNYGILYTEFVTVPCSQPRASPVCRTSMSTSSDCFHSTGDGQLHFCFNGR